MDEIVNLILLENLEHDENQQNIRIPRNPRSAFDNMSERAFIKTFRLSKDLVDTLSNSLEPFITPKRRPTDLDIRSKVSKQQYFYCDLCKYSFHARVVLNNFFVAGSYCIKFFCYW